MPRFQNSVAQSCFSSAICLNVMKKDPPPSSKSESTNVEPSSETKSPSSGLKTGRARVPPMPRAQGIPTERRRGFRLTDLPDRKPPAVGRFRDSGAVERGCSGRRSCRFRTARPDSNVGCRDSLHQAASARAVGCQVIEFAATGKGGTILAWYVGKTVGNGSAHKNPDRRLT